MVTKVKLVLGSVVLVSFLSAAGLVLAAPEQSDCGAGCKMKAWGQTMKCDMRYSLDMVKCKKDVACKDGCRQARTGCRGQAEGK